MAEADDLNPKYALPSPAPALEHPAPVIQAPQASVVKMEQEWNTDLGVQLGFIRPGTRGWDDIDEEEHRDGFKGFSAFGEGYGLVKDGQGSQTY
jgi:hypothetical protein